MAIGKTTTAEALLGMLSLRPMSGYEIRQTIEASIGNFWQESYGQIYPTLKRLVAEGLAEVKTEVGGRAKRGGPPRKLYQLTAAGRRRLRSWMKMPPVQQVPRNELLLKIFFAGQGAPGLVRAHVEEFRTKTEGERRRYAQIRESLMREHARHPELPYWLMTLEYGEIESEAMIAWCDRTLAVSKHLDEVRDAS